MAVVDCNHAHEHYDNTEEVVMCDLWHIDNEDVKNEDNTQK